MWFWIDNIGNWGSHCKRRDINIDSFVCFCLTLRKARKNTVETLWKWLYGTKSCVCIYLCRHIYVFKFSFACIYVRVCVCDSIFLHIVHWKSLEAIVLNSNEQTHLASSVWFLNIYHFLSKGPEPLREMFGYRAQEGITYNEHWMSYCTGKRGKVKINNKVCKKEKI